MKHQEIQKDKAWSYVKRLYADNIQIIPTDVTLSFYTRGGTLLISDDSDGSVTIAADGTISYTLGATYTSLIDEYYKVVIDYIAGGASYSFSENYSVVAVPLVNNVRDEDLFVYCDELRNKILPKSGLTSDNGTTSTLVDKNLQNDYRDYLGGRGEVIVTDGNGDPEKVEFEITAFAKSTGTISFSPAASVVVGSGIRYIIRPSYKKYIEEAYDQFVWRDLRNKVPVAAGFVDSNVTHNLTVFKALELFCQSQVEVEGDKWDLRQARYERWYDRELSAFNHPYDGDEDGNINHGEQQNTADFSSARIEP